MTASRSEVSGLFPPADLSRRQPSICTLTRGTRLHRFFTARFDPIYFDRSDAGRFNSADASYGVLYCSETTDGAFAETFLRTPGRTLLSDDLIASKAYVYFDLLDDLTLVEMTGPGLAHLGATAEVTHGGTPYAASHAWSLALHRHPVALGGISYTARHDDAERCVAIYDRSAGVIGPTKTIINLHTDWFYKLLDKYRVGIAPPAQ